MENILDYFSFIKTDYTVSSLIELIAVIALAPIVLLAIKYASPLIIKLFLSRVIDFKKDIENAQKRVKTLSGVVEATGFIIILIYIIFHILSFFQIDVRPLIAGAGVLSFAVAFGSQSLIKDLISGVFIILENQFNQGDWIKVDNFEGKVIEMNLRRTVLQTTKGARHIIPNGNIEIVTNNSNQYRVVTMDLPVKVSQINKVNKILEKVCKEVAKDEKYKKDIIEAPKPVGINEINEFGSVIRIWVKVKSGTHLKIKREISKRIIQEFNKKKIELPGGRILNTTKTQSA
ncbi:MAG: mechanosensitive ion channel [Candidatus Moranbacteria bacterium]|nr:mechanosensitive ion channel [Candidatus Moranbacteria bacterium]